MGVPGLIRNYNASSDVLPKRCVMMDANGNFLHTDGSKKAEGVTTDVGSHIGKRIDVILDGMPDVIAGGAIAIGKTVKGSVDGKVLECPDNDPLAFGIAYQVADADGDQIQIKII